MKKVLAFAVVVAFAFTTSGCATVQNAQHGVAIGIKTAHTGLALADETEALLVCGRPTAVEGHCISFATHIELSKKFIIGYKYVREAVDLTLSIPEGAPTPAQIGVLATKVALLVQEILADLPDSKPKAKLLSQPQVKAIQEVR